MIQNLGQAYGATDAVVNSFQVRTSRSSIDSLLQKTLLEEVLSGCSGNVSTEDKERMLLQRLHRIAQEQHLDKN